VAACFAFCGSLVLLYPRVVPLVLLVMLCSHELPGTLHVQL